MQLKPARTSSPPVYPARRTMPTSFRDWMRRVAVATGVSVALCFGGCYGATRVLDSDGTDPPPQQVVGTIATVGILQPTPPDTIFGGEQPATLPFVCSPTRPDHNAENLYINGYFEGNLCGEETAWAFLDLEDGIQDPFTVSLWSSMDAVYLAIIDPEGREVAELGPDLAEVDITPLAGRWTFAATSGDPIEHGYEWFSLSLWTR